MKDKAQVLNINTSAVWLILPYLFKILDYNVLEQKSLKSSFITKLGFHSVYSDWYLNISFIITYAMNNLQNNYKNY